MSSTVNTPPPLQRLEIQLPVTPAVAPPAAEPVPDEEDCYVVDAKTEIACGPDPLVRLFAGPEPVTHAPDLAESVLLESDLALRQDAFDNIVVAFHGFKNVAPNQLSHQDTAVLALIQIARESPDTDLAKAAATALIEGFYEDIAPLLFPILEDWAIQKDDPDRAEFAVAGLTSLLRCCHVFGGAVVDGLSQTLAHTMLLADQSIREACAFILGDGPESYASPRSAACAVYALARLVRDAPPNASESAKFLAMQGLDRMLKDSPFFVIEETCYALAWMAINATHEDCALLAVTLLTTTAHSDHHRSLYACFALGRVAVGEGTVDFPYLEEDKITAHAVMQSLIPGQPATPYLPATRAAREPIRHMAWNKLTVLTQHSNPLIATHAVHALLNLRAVKVQDKNQATRVRQHIVEMLSSPQSIPVQMALVYVIDELEWTDLPREFLSQLSDEALVLSIASLGKLMATPEHRNRLDELLPWMRDPRPQVAEAAVQGTMIYIANVMVSEADPGRDPGFIRAAEAVLQAVVVHPSERVYAAAGWFLGHFIDSDILQISKRLQHESSGPQEFRRAAIIQALIEKNQRALFAAYWPFMGTRCIQFFDSGNTLSLRSLFLKSIIPLPPQFNKSTPPLLSSNMDFVSGIPLPREAAEGLKIGRCRVFETDAGIRVIKFARAGAPESAPVREIWAQLQLASIPGLESPIPRPLLNERGKFSLYTDSDAIIFDAGKKYFRYVNAAGVTRHEFLRGVGHALHDAGVLARYGYYHTDLIPLRHNREDGARFRIQRDGGCYRILPDLLNDYFGGRQGMGRLDDVDGSLKFPNICVDGLRDFEHIYRVEEILDDESSDDPIREWSALRKESNAAALLDMVLMGNAYFSVTLLIGERMALEARQRRYALESWHDEKTLARWAQILMHTMARGYAARWTITENQARRVITPRVNWQRLARQLAFFMSGAYVPFVAPTARMEDFPKNEIYGEDVFVHGFGPYRDGSYHPGAGFVGPDGNESKTSLGPLNGPFPITELETLVYAMALSPDSL